MVSPADVSPVVAVAVAVAVANCWLDIELATNHHVVAKHQLANVQPA